MLRASAQRPARFASLLLAISLLCGAGVASARSRQPLKTVTYRGYAVAVPRSWPVFDLSRDPHTCVRFDRNAVYLGTPGPDQNCPANAVGRTEAILIEPLRATAASANAEIATPSPGGTATTFVVASARVEVTATWLRHRGLVAQALHRPSLSAAGAARPRRRAIARAASRASAAGTIYTGPGFDACYAPSPHAMSAWASSPYRAIGIYIGGANAACPPSRDPNLTPTWLGNEATAGWHFIPTYVGLQAPSNSCGCAGINPSQATAEGAAAARDAVGQAQSLGIGPGNPIYDDMEYYSRTGTNTSAVLAFLSGWTSQLHTSGYLSGVYGNGDSAITDLVDQYGTSYREPDDIWIADWNGQQTTSDPYAPSSEWANHQRLHQYSGGHNETYGGVTINIDSNYLDAATAGASGAAPSQGPPPVPPPSLAISPASDGTTNVTASWAGGSGLAGWRVLGGPSIGSLTSVGGGSAHGQTRKFAVRSAAAYFAVQALDSSGAVLANSSTVPTPAHVVLYGHSAFVNQATGTGGIPAGCYTGTVCHVSTTIASGRVTIATTGSESIQPNSTSILYFTLTPRGRMLLRHAPAARLGVKVTSREVSGTTAVASLSLIPFATSGRGPARSVTQSTVAQVMGVTDFVFARGAGGVLAGCATAAPCPIAATLSVGGKNIATTRPELVGGGELGYLFFYLTARGRTLLNGARGNQLGATLTLSSGNTVALARIALVQFG